MKTTWEWKFFLWKYSSKILLFQLLSCHHVSYIKVINFFWLKIFYRCLSILTNFIFPCIFSWNWNFSYKKIFKKCFLLLLYNHGSYSAHERFYGKRFWFCFLFGMPLCYSRGFILIEGSYWGRRLFHDFFCSRSQFNKSENKLRPFFQKPII